jgi:hypothetical protein
MKKEKLEVIKGYKGFDKGLVCRDFQYEIGKVYTHKGKIGPCESGFHFCREFKNVNNFYEFSNENYMFAEVEAIGDIIDDDDGIKSVTDKIKIVREISREEMLQMLNLGIDNTGFLNTGDSNTGDSNTGDSNTGDSNTGYCNTGDSNTGDSNTGDSNTGYRNTGDRNTGYRNTGDSNTGYCNTGYCNTGNRNTGDWNKTNRSSGVLCNVEPALILFNKKTTMTYNEWTETRAYDILNSLEKSKWICFSDMNEQEKEKYKESAETCDGYLKKIPRKEASEKLWGEISIQDKYEIMTLPNFDLDVFNDIMELNITKKEYKEVLKKC